MGNWSLDGTSNLHSSPSGIVWRILERGESFHLILRSNWSLHGQEKLFLRSHHLLFLGSGWTGPHLLEELNPRLDRVWSFGTKSRLGKVICSCTYRQSKICYVGSYNNNRNFNKRRMELTWFDWWGVKRYVIKFITYIFNVCLCGYIETLNNIYTYNFSHFM